LGQYNSQGAQAQYTVQSYSETSIGIRGSIQFEADLKTTEQQLYLLREGKTEEVVIQTDDGKIWRGLYKINELYAKTLRDFSTYLGFAIPFYGFTKA
jgi:hypothetical protein